MIKSEYNSGHLSGCFPEVKMRALYISFLFLCLMWIPTFGQQQPDFNAYFTDHTLRIDYYHSGDSNQEFISIDKMYKQGVWAGNPRHLLDLFNNGRYYIKVYAAKSGKLIFSRGFDSYFGEYKTTGIAQKGVKKTFHESVLIPFPKIPVKLSIQRRERNQELLSIFEKKIKPNSIQINNEELITGVKVFPILKNGHPHQKVDLAIIAEGYTRKEVDKLKKDFGRMKQIFFKQEPYKSYQDRFNIYGVFKASVQSGCDEPRRLIFRNTSLGTTFNSLGSERYLLTEDNRALRDIAAHVPYDALIIMINQKRYGGGGIYNFYCTFTADSQWHPYLLLHEFGHSFAGLADEYYTSSTAYNDFYPQGIEPLEPNITALLDIKNPKWKNLLSKNIQIPTPWEKEDFDAMEKEYQVKRKKINNKIARMSRQGLPKAKISEVKEESERLSKENAMKIDKFLKNSRFNGKVGLFMGAGYASEGLYRPMVDCIMFTKGIKPYCQVCNSAIINIIKSYSD
jgi:hypothetical protein